MIDNARSGLRRDYVRVLIRSFFSNDQHIGERKMAAYGEANIGLSLIRGRMLIRDAYPVLAFFEHDLFM